ncbi:MAG: hypothetical protein ABI477_15490 [Chryseolinea sp.]
MKNLAARTVFVGLILSLSLPGSEVKAQLATASALLSNHDIHTFINSSEEFAEVEKTIDELSAQLHDSYTNYPNLQFTASYDNDQLIGFVITGVKDSKDANTISLILMELQSLGEIASSADLKFLPSNDMKTARVSKKESRM